MMNELSVPGLKPAGKRSKAEENTLWEFYLKEYEFISNLLVHVQKARGLDIEPDDERVQALSAEKTNSKKPVRLFPVKKGDKKPAKTIQELQEKLAALRGKHSLPYKERLLKKGLKNKIKKKEKKEGRLKKKKLKIAEKLSNKSSNVLESLKPVKPVINNEGKMVFSKFDFSQSSGKDDGQHKQIKDPVTALKLLKKKEEKIKALEETGNKNEIANYKTQTLWKNVLLKSEGVKVKDDPELIKKSIKKSDLKKKRSSEKWKAREKKVIQDKEARQDKRKENIKARAKQKKLNKIKKAAKRGRLVAGF